MVGGIQRAENIERVCCARDEYAPQFTGNTGQMLAGDPTEWLRGSFQENLSTWLVLLALRIAIRDRRDGHSISNLSPEGIKYGLDHLTDFLLKSLVFQPLLEAINGHESHSVFLGW